MDKITILLIDDHRLLREAWELTLNLQPNITVVGSTGNSIKAMQLVREHSPMVILLDIIMQELNGFDLAQQILNEWPESRIIAVTCHTRPEYAKKMFDIGVKGYITKDSPYCELIDGILAVGEGRSYICKEMVELFTGDHLLKNGKNINSLTGREMEIIRYLKKGLSSREIGVRLSLAAKTIDVHRYHILKKLGVKNTASLINLINFDEYNFSI